MFRPHAYNNPLIMKKKNRIKNKPRKHPKSAKNAPLAQKKINALVRLYQTGKLEDTLKECRVLLKTSPDSIIVLNIYGVVLMGQGRFQEALASFNRALKVNPGFIDAHINRGNLLQHMGDPVKALNDYNQCIKLNPGHVKAHSNRGNVLKTLGQYKAAVKSYQKAIKLDPGYAMAHSNLGISFQEIGEIDQAINSFEQAIKAKPDYAEVYRNLSNLKTFKPGDPLIHSMLNLQSRPELDPMGRMHLCYALAKAFQDMDDYDTSFAYLEKGNDLHKVRHRYSIRKDRILFEKIKSLFLKLVPFREANNHEICIKTPIFIVGMPRSGTSLVEQILASHPDVYGAGELYKMNSLLSPLLSEYDDLTDRGAMPETLFALTANIAKAYQDEITRLSGNENRVTDKMPLNFQWLGMILLTVPGAKIVHIARHPVATCFSNYKHFFSHQGNGFAYDQKDTAEFYLLYQNLMDFWNHHLPGEIYNLSYEALTENQEHETRRLLKFCGLDWNDACLDFHSTKRAVTTASAAQVRRKMYQGSSEAWKRYESHLQPMIQILDRSLAS